MYGTIYTSALSRSDADALRDLLRPVPLDEQRYISRRDAYRDIHDRCQPTNRHRNGQARREVTACAR